MKDDTSAHGSKAIFAVLLEGTVKPFSMKPWDNAFQKWAFLSIALGFLLAAMSITMAIVFHKQSLMGWLFLPAACLMLIGVLVYGYSVASALPKALTHAKEALVASAAEEFTHGIERILALTKQFEPRRLDYAHDCLAMVTEHMRDRMRIVFGPHEKLGIIPSVVAIFVYVREAHLSVGDLSVGAWVAAWAFIALIALYAMALYGVYISHKAEALILVLKHAAAKKDRDLRSSPPED